MAEDEQLEWLEAELCADEAAPSLASGRSDPALTCMMFSSSVWAWKSSSKWFLISSVTSIVVIKSRASVASVTGRAVVLPCAGGGGAVFRVRSTEPSSTRVFVSVVGTGNEAFKAVVLPLGLNLRLLGTFSCV